MLHKAAVEALRWRSPMARPPNVGPAETDARQAFRAPTGNKNQKTWSNKMRKAIERKAEDVEELAGPIIDSFRLENEF